MIQCDELRIRNFVQDKYGNLIEVEEIQCDRINVFEGDPEFQTLLKDIFPIEINDCILLSLGFKKKDYEECYIYQKGCFMLVFGKKNSNFIFIHRGIESVKIESVHMLQNMYFMIMREDLTLEFPMFKEDSPTDKLLKITTWKQN